MFALVEPLNVIENQYQQMFGLLTTSNILINVIVQSKIDVKLN